MRPHALVSSRTRTLGDLFATRKAAEDAPAERLADEPECEDAWRTAASTSNFYYHVGIEHLAGAFGEARRKSAAASAPGHRASQ